MAGEFNEGADRKEAIYEARRIFERVQQVPYILGLDGNPNKLLTENKGNCSRKHLYLANKLIPLGYKVSLGVAVFDWKELPIPKGIISLLSDSIDTHLFLYASLGEKESVVDATWDPQMPEGFVKNVWDGESSTQIGVPVKSIRREDIRILQTKALIGEPLKIMRNLFQPKKPTPFNDAFNMWLGRSK